MRRLLAVLAVIPLAAAPLAAEVPTYSSASLLAQSPPPAPPPRFDVVSIQPSPHPGNNIIPPVRSGRFNTRNVTAAALIAKAWGLHCCNLITGGPAWLAHEGFTIQATAPTKTVPPDQFRLMLQQLLLTRFQLKMHFVTRPEPAYLLTVAASGSKLQPASAPCDASEGLLPYDPAGLPACGLQQRLGPDDKTFTWTGRSITMPELALVFENLALPDPQAVVDQTGLTGRYDFEFTYHLPPSAPGSQGMNDPDERHAAIAALVKDLHAQLGLDLDPFHTHKVPLPTLVVDAITIPSNN